MLKYIEIDPLPETCRNCNDDCYNCENAGDRWILEERDRIRIRMIRKKNQILRYKNDNRMRHFVEDWLKEYDELKKELERIDSNE